ncbi:MAG TPA: hypothetical protein VM029_09060, partial [Opitutaceae bacterium]|nr:hypothetical protein [Opitutaceae bacterium]
DEIIDLAVHPDGNDVLGELAFAREPISGDFEAPVPLSRHVSHPQRLFERGRRAVFAKGAVNLKSVFSIT